MADVNDASLGTAICRLLEREVRPIAERLIELEKRVAKLEAGQHCFSFFRRNRKEKNA
jgi:hypothetical protein